MKAYKRIISLFFCSFLVLNLSCVKLEEDTSSLLLLEQLHDEGAILSALTPIYKNYQDVVRWPDQHRITMFGADDITTWHAGARFQYRMFDGFFYGDGQNADVYRLDQCWINYWKTIYKANAVILGLKTSKAPQTIVKLAEAEARFFRALCYFDLVRSFGNVPILFDEAKNGKDVKRATVLENYQLIEADLLFAEKYLPDPSEVDAVGRVSMAAAKAVLANLYLTWGGWPLKDIAKLELAAAKAKEIIDMKYFDLQPIDKLWLLEGQNSRESIYSVQFSKTEDIRSGYPSSFSFHESRGWSDIFPERQFFYDFPSGPRKDATFYTHIPQRRYDSALGMLVDKDPPTVHWTESQRNHPMYKKFTISADLTVRNRVTGYRAIEIIRYAEVLLIYSEASAGSVSGSLTIEGLEALNQVRRRAAGKDYAIPDIETDLTLGSVDDVFDERGWEMAGEMKRWYDLVRLEKLADIVAKRDPTEEVALSYHFSGITWKHYIAPIPESIITNNKLIQNPEGFKVK